MPFQGRKDNFIVYAIIGILAVIGVTSFSKFRRQRKAAECFSLIVRAADGPLPPGAACPLSEKPYPSGGPVRCPAAADHLPTHPRFVAGRFEQTFPAAAAGEIFGIVGRPLQARIEVTPGGAVVDLTPRFWWKVLLGPALQLVGLFALGVLGTDLVIDLRKGASGSASRRIGYVVVIVLILLPGWWTFSSAWGRETWTFDRATRDVTKRTYVAGREWSSETHAGIRALAPVQGGGSAALMLVDGDRNLVSCFSVPDDALGVLAPLHAALFER